MADGMSSMDEFRTQCCSGIGRAVRRNLRRALSILFAATLAPSAFAQGDFNSAQIVHADEATNTVLLSVWSQDKSFMYSSAHLFRGEFQPWRGKIPPVLREGITVFFTDVRVNCESCSPGAIPEGSPSYRNAMIDFSNDAALVLGHERPYGSLSLHFYNLVQVSEPCRGKWIWAEARPECIQGAPPKENSLGEAWQSWSERDKLDVLLYLHDYRADGIYPFPLCAFAKDRDALRQCRPAGTGEYLDQVVAVAHDLAPLPSIPDTARGAAMRANEAMGAVKTTADLMKVLREYDQVVDLAPWWADAYYNRARVEALYGLDLWAIADYQRFLKLNPSPQDAADVREKIGELQ